MDGKQLKNSILQWAIQGKLVPQNPKDEPASKLLERIAESRNESSLSLPKGTSSTSLRGAKAEPAASGAWRKQSKALSSRIYRENGVWYEQVGTATPKDISDEIPFEIPESWAWCRFFQVVHIASNLVDSSKYLSFKHIAPDNIEKGSGKLFACKTVAEDKVISNNHLFKKGQIIYSKIRPLLRKCVIAPFEGLCSADMYPLESSIDNSYVMQILLSDMFNKQVAEICASRVKMPKINQEELSRILMPLPPLAEQKRIVAKLEQVLPLAEEYGAAQEQLDKLNKELPEALKKSILQEAIQGKLVPQNPKDESAQKLLERIALARHSERSEESSKSSKKSSTSLRGAKATKQSKNPPSRIYRENGSWYEQIGSATPKDIIDEIPFEIPETWAWCRLGSICDYLHRGKSPVYSDKKILPVMAQKCNQWDKIYTEKCLFADPKTIEKYTTEQYLQVGDVIINSTGGGTVGRTGFVDEYVFSEYDKFVADSHVTVVRSNKNINSKYVYYFLITPLIQRGIEERCSGSTNQIELGTETIKNYLFPLPPLAEQKRIVAKLEQLFKVL